MGVWRRGHCTDKALRSAQRPSVLHGETRRWSRLCLMSQRCPAQSHWEDWVSSQKQLFAMEAMHLLDNWGKVIIACGDSRRQANTRKLVGMSLHETWGCVAAWILASSGSCGVSSHTKTCSVFSTSIFDFWLFCDFLRLTLMNHFTGLSGEQIWWYHSSVLLSWGQSTSEPYFPSLLHNILGMQMTPGALWAFVIALMMCFLFFSVWLPELSHNYKLLTSLLLTLKLFSHLYYPYIIHGYKYTFVQCWLARDTQN